jgi:MoxR-like ATPase
MATDSEHPLKGKPRPGVLGRAEFEMMVRLDRIYGDYFLDAARRANMAHSTLARKLVMDFVDEDREKRTARKRGRRRKEREAEYEPERTLAEEWAWRRAMGELSKRMAELSRYVAAIAERSRW